MKVALAVLFGQALATMRALVNEEGEIMDEDHDEDESFGVRGSGSGWRYSSTRTAVPEEQPEPKPSVSRSGDDEYEAPHEAAPGALVEDEEKPRLPMKGDRRRMPADWTPPSLRDFADEAALLEEADYEDLEDYEDEEYDHEDFEDFEGLDSAFLEEEEMVLRGDRRRMPANWLEQADPQVQEMMQSLLEGDTAQFQSYVDDFFQKQERTVKGDRRRMPVGWAPPPPGAEDEHDGDALLEEEDLEEEELDEDEEGPPRRVPQDWEPPHVFAQVKGDRRRMPQDWLQAADPGVKAALKSLVSGDDGKFRDHVEQFFGRKAEAVKGDRRRIPAGWTPPSMDDLELAMNA